MVALPAIRLLERVVLRAAFAAIAQDGPAGPICHLPSVPFGRRAINIAISALAVCRVTRDVCFRHQRQGEPVCFWIGSSLSGH